MTVSGFMNIVRQSELQLLICIRKKTQLYIQCECTLAIKKTVSIKVGLVFCQTHFQNGKKYKHTSFQRKKPE